MAGTDDPRRVAAALAAGDQRTAARLITRIERLDPAVAPVLRALYPVADDRRVVGVTGPPGAGKSTLIARLVGHWRKEGLRVAVLAVDPSSRFSGGAVLGDRLRMAEHGSDAAVFIRSMAARDRLGGLARAAADALTVLGAMPWDRILVETVGVGQSETDVAREAAVVVLVLTPAAGDEVQAVKAGVMEIADVFVVNKGDLPGADRAVRAIAEQVAVEAEHRGGATWLPPVLRVEATTGTGVAGVAEAVAGRLAALAAHPGEERTRRLMRARHRIAEIVRDRLGKGTASTAGAAFAAAAERVADRREDPYAAAEELLTGIGAVPG